MSDAKYFQRGKIQELRTELNSDKKDTKHAKKKVVMKKIVANMTMGNDMSPLFSDVIACMNIPVLEIKKMVYLYLINYARSKPDMALLAVNSFVRDVSDPNPLIRALAIRTMSYIQVDKITDCLCEPLRHCLRDRDPYVRKTAAICVAKLYMHDRVLVENEGFLEGLRALLDDENSTVVANTVVALSEIADRSDKFDLNFDVSVANKLLTALNECSEWGQAYILESLMHVVPQEHNDAELLADRVAPRLQHANSAVVLTATRVILYLINYIQRDDVVNGLYKKLGPPLVTLLHNGPEVQYVALRNILLILQRQPNFLKNEMKVFFCKYNDPIYVKLAKLEIMFRLANEENVDMVLGELKEYATEVDVDFVRKSVRSIGRCAIKIERAADRCINALVELIQTKVNYVVQEAVVVIKDIFRKYPNRYESLLSTLCSNLSDLDEPEAKASMIWVIGQYADRITNADELLSSFLDTFKDETAEVQLALLTAVVKLFIKRPSVGQELVPRVLKYSTEEVDNPDLRDRGFIYWRLLSSDPVAAKAIVLSDKPAISTETDNMEGTLLDELLLHISTLASIYHKPPNTFIGGVKQRRLIPSKAFVQRSTARPELPEGVEETGGDNANIYGAGQMFNPYANEIAPSLDTGGGANMNNLLDLDMGGAFDDGQAGGMGGVGGLEGDAFDMFGGLPSQSMAAGSSGVAGDLGDLLFGGPDQGGLGQPQQGQQPFGGMYGGFDGMNPMSGDLAGFPGGAGMGMPTNAGMGTPFGGLPGQGFGAGTTPAGQPMTGTPFGANQFSPGIQSSQNSPFGLPGSGVGTYSADSALNSKHSPFGAPVISGGTSTLDTQPRGPSVIGGSNGPAGVGQPPSDRQAPALDPFSKTSATANATLDPFAKTSTTINTAPTTTSSATASLASATSLTIASNPFGAFSQGPTSPPADVAPIVGGMSQLNVGGAGAAFRPVGAAGAQDLFSVGLQSGFVPPKSVFLNAQSGKGLEITGTFSRRQGQVYMEMTFANNALQPLGDFAILFNKNSFSMVPGPLDVRSPLFPNQTADVSLLIKTEGIPQNTTPVNNLQVAVKTTPGIIYFQTLVPLHVLFAETGELDQETWLKMWQADMGAVGEGVCQVDGLIGVERGVDGVRDRLRLNNVFTVAQRVVEGVPVLYTSTRLADSTVLLSEFKFDPSLASCQISTKSYASHVTPAFHDALRSILTM
ncbi:AP-2 complex subunit beta [Rhizophlyctis rosea]|nr:AP-2 complex subunit beta [Rhizophlyctis rosea]